MALVTAVVNTTADAFDTNSAPTDTDGIGNEFSDSRSHSTVCGGCITFAIPSRNDNESSSYSDFGECLLLEYLPWSNSENIMSFETKLNVFRVVAGCLIPFVSLLGMPVNVLNAVIFYKQGLQERVNFLLFCLATTDIIVDAFLFVSTIEYFYTMVEGDFQLNGPVVTAVTNYISIIYGSVYVSGFISTVIAVERCLCITYPLIARDFLKTKTMGIIVAIASVILPALIYIVSAQKYLIGCGYYPQLKLKFPVYQPSAFYLENKMLLDILNGIMYGGILPCFFLLTTIITTAITSLKLKRAAAWRQHTSSSSMESKEVALTKMLIAVSCLFAVCTLPNVILRVAPMFVEEFRLGGRYQNLLLAGISIIYLANVINSSSNFVFYYSMGTRYRLILKGLFARK